MTGAYRRLLTTAAGLLLLSGCGTVPVAVPQLATATPAAPSCPPRAPSVFPPAPPAAGRALVPGSPRAAVVCRYRQTGSAVPGASRSLPRSELVPFAETLDELPPAPTPTGNDPDGPVRVDTDPREALHQAGDGCQPHGRSRPTGPVDLALFGYADGTVITVLIDSTGCRIATNGRRTSMTTASITDTVDVLLGRTG